MTTIAEVGRFLETFAPISLAEDWDNVGLLVGDAQQPVERVMTCLTITPASAAEAVRSRANLIVAHHPLPFKPLKRLTTASTPGRLLLELIRGGVAVYSPHTAFDSAAEGINQQLAEGLGLTAIEPLVVKPTDPTGLGSGRFGRLSKPSPLSEVAGRVKTLLRVKHVQAVGDLKRSISSLAVACGSAGSFLEPAARAGCDLLVTGETSFHTCLEAEASDVALLLPGHYASERFAVERLAEVLGKQFSNVEVWASRDERDPLVWA